MNLENICITLQSTQSWNGLFLLGVGLSHLLPSEIELIIYFWNQNWNPGSFSDTRYQPWPRVKQFLMDLEPGSFVCDVGEIFIDIWSRILLATDFQGCGNGKYLSCNPLLYNIGVDRCKTLTELAHAKDNEVHAYFKCIQTATDKPQHSSRWLKLIFPATPIYHTNTNVFMFKR